MMLNLKFMAFALAGGGSDDVVNQAKRSLAEFQQFLANKDLYPNISEALVILGFFLKIFSLVLGLAGVIVVAIVTGKTVIDVITILTNGWFDANSKFNIAKYSSFKGNDIPPSLGAYIMKHWIHTTVALAFAVLLLSNQMLPLTAKLTAAMSGGINQLLAIDFSLGDAKQSELDDRVRASQAVENLSNDYAVNGVLNLEKWGQASALVSILPEGSTKDSLQRRLDNLKKIAGTK